MGHVGREIVGDELQSIRDDLQKAMAAELNDAYRYRFLTKFAEGLQARELAEWFEQTAQHEWNHLGMWMERLISLGGRPLSRPEQAADYTYAPYEEPPEDSTDLRKMIEDSLKGERAAIRFYNDLVKKTQHIDPVTAQMAQAALADETTDEDDLERFLASFETARQAMGRAA